MTTPENDIRVESGRKELGARLREERERIGMSQTDFAGVAGLTRAAQYNYEQGIRDPDTAYLSAVAENGIDTSYVLTGKRQGSPEAGRAAAADQIVGGVLAIGNRRSAEYRRGMLDVLRFRLEGERIQCPYREGTPQFDAYFAGNDRGHTVWRAMQQTEPAA